MNIIIKALKIAFSQESSAQRRKRNRLKISFMPLWNHVHDVILDLKNLRLSAFDFDYRAFYRAMLHTLCSFCKTNAIATDFRIDHKIILALVDCTNRANW
jgi:hypothetical protein